MAARSKTGRTARRKQKPEPTGSCWCGCGGKTDRFFAPGHDRRAVEALIHDEYGSVAGLLLAHGRAPRRGKRRRSSA